MKTALVLAFASLTGLSLSVARADEPARKAPEPPAPSPGLSPEVIAFLKPVAPAEGDTDLTRALKERHNSAVTLLDERAKEHKSGLRDISSVFEAARLALDAKLDLATNDEARTQVLKHGLAVAKQVEEQLRQQLARGFGSKADLERARYARLSLEVELLRGKPKTAPKPE